MSRKVAIVNATQGAGITSYKSACRYVQSARAAWVDPEQTRIRFLETDLRHLAACEQATRPMDEPTGRHHGRPQHRASLLVASYSGSDSGLNTARYPLPLQVSTGPRFPGLARVGAGL